MENDIQSTIICYANTCSIDRSKHQKPKAKYPFSRTEASATSWLQGQYTTESGGVISVGDSPNDILPDGVKSNPKGPVPEAGGLRQRRRAIQMAVLCWNICRGGIFRGVVTGDSTHVPFVRRNGSALWEVHADEHITGSHGDGTIAQVRIFLRFGHSAGLVCRSETQGMAR